MDIQFNQQDWSDAFMYVLIIVIFFTLTALYKRFDAKEKAKNQQIMDSIEHDCQYDVVDDLPISNDEQIMFKELMKVRQLEEQLS